MEWYVYYYDSVDKSIKPYNVLGSSAMYEFIKKNRKKYKNSKEDFAKELRAQLMHQYWSRYEWEIIVSPWGSGDDREAVLIDVYDQIRINWVAFIDYCWNFKEARTI